MAFILKGAPVAAALDEKTAAKAAALRAGGVTPTLAVLRVGEREDDLSYERTAIKRCGKVGVALRSVELTENVDNGFFFEVLESLNRDPAIHGILLLRPLPKQLDEEAAREVLRPEKDVDGCTDVSLAGVFTGSAFGFPPCTARAVMEILRYYGIEMKGKKTVIVGRSLVIGRPMAMLLLHADATVTLCHSRTEDLPALTRGADIVVAASGRAESIGADCLRPGQTVIDVGCSWSEEKQKLCGDVCFEQAEPLVGAITPVPGGVGGVTTSVLAGHVVEAARRAAL